MSVPSSTFQTDNISNSTAEEDAGNRYNVCMRTGFRVKPGELIEDAYGSLVRRESFDKRHPQELIRPLAEELTGPIRPETQDTFIGSTDTVYQVEAIAGIFSKSWQDNVFNNPITSGNTYYGLVWVKSINSPYFGVGLFRGSTNYAQNVYNLNTGKIVETIEGGSITEVRSDITPFYDDWYRLRFEWVPSVDEVTIVMGMPNDATASDGNILSLKSWTTTSTYLPAVYVQQPIVSTVNLFENDTGSNVITESIPDWNTLQNVSVTASSEENINLNQVSASDL